VVVVNISGDDVELDVHDEILLASVPLAGGVLPGRGSSSGRRLVLPRLQRTVEESTDEGVTWR
jgi:hypothetical protein